MRAGAVILDAFINEASAHELERQWGQAQDLFEKGAPSTWPGEREAPGAGAAGRRYCPSAAPLQ